MRRRLAAIHLLPAGMLGLALLTLGGPASAENALRPVTVFAASSTTEAVEAAAARCRAETGRDVRAVFASSSLLARQIAKGAPADIFLSADPQWMNHLAAQDRIVAQSRRELLSNRLVLIARTRPETPIALSRETDLRGLLGRSRLAMGDPAHVPAGRYAREALETLGLWAQVADRIAPAANVRAALALVARGETDLGIVYATDAAISDDVRVVGSFPNTAQPAIRYPIALLAEAFNGDSSAAMQVLDCLCSPSALDVFRAHGFAIAHGAPDA